MIAKQLTEEVYKCIKCGLCSASCPVYKQLLFEGASPRGKVQLIKKILEGHLEPSRNFSRLLFTCLLCETCTANCPSGLELDRLMKAMRSDIIKDFKLPWRKRMLFSLLTSDRLLPFCLFWGRTLEASLSWVLPDQEEVAGGIPSGKLPRLSRKTLLSRYPETIRADDPKGRVLYFPGCATNYLFTNVGHAAIKVLKRLGIEIFLPGGLKCCGLPILLAGAREAALKNIRQNLEIFRKADVDAIVVDCAACGAALQKEYVHVLEEMGEDAGVARAMAARVMDLSRYLSRFDLGPFLGPIEGRVTYHDPCHLVRSQGVRSEPRSLLKQVPGLEYVEMAGADVCCGGGGSFQWEHPEVASGIARTKTRAILETGANLVASGCPGCRMQIHGHLGDAHIQVLHPVEILAKALISDPASSGQ